MPYGYELHRPDRNAPKDFRMRIEGKGNKAFVGNNIMRSHKSRVNALEPL